ncbi:hypothetical protein TA3x_004508 [Tundrisphaera sp. TA3]|uniref:hypothetical protein n=1 Tax=Tundrisphaera sp. TA3 TaxID=3435775 RepID=UPI003EC0DC5A
MPASPAQIEANRKNSLKGTGPTSEEGKARSRSNALKHGMTGAGIVLPAEDAAEVERLTEAFRAELKPEGEVGDVLVRRMAVHSVRMDRAVVQESAALSRHVREATRAFMASDDRYAGNARTLRAEAANRALFDASREAILARKYEAASERSFLAALRELRRMRAEAGRAAVEELRASKAVASTPAEASMPAGELASFFPALPEPQAAPQVPASSPNVHRALALTSAFLGMDSEVDGGCGLPITIGRAR